MKYWRGYLVAFIVMVCTWALTQFCADHTQLVDMIYPYVDRIIIDYLANWSANFEGCLWQMCVVFLVVLLNISVVLMIVLRWNPIQWFGWVLTAVSILAMLNTGIYGLNQYAGPISEDIRLSVNEYSVGSLERAATYYGKMASDYSKKVSRSNGQVQFEDFDALNVQAAEGFQVLTYEMAMPIFSGTTVPVKQLGWINRYDGVTGMTVGITGEAAVNPNVPDVGMPFAICHEMSHRMCIYSHSDANFGAFLACTNNTSEEFVYSGYLMAYRSCYNALAAIDTNLGRDALKRVEKNIDSRVMDDITAYNEFLEDSAMEVDADFTNMLVSWHTQNIARFEDGEDENNGFDPMDETDERFQDILEPYRSEGA